MTVEGCREWRERLGAYVLGHLSEDERAATAAHIDGCAACRAEAESLSPIAELLPKADPARLGTVPAPPPELGERISAQIAGERGVARERGRRRRRRFAFGFSAAAAAAASIAIALVLAIGSSPSGDTDAQTVAFHSVPRGVAISAKLAPRPFGTQIQMWVHGIRSGTLCQVSLRRADGTELPAGSFRYRYGEDDPAVLTSALDLSAARAITVHAGGRTFVAPMRQSVGADAATSTNQTEKENS